MRFYVKGWSEVGTKKTLQTLISDSTGIDVEILESGDTSTACVAQRMSWASKRETTRIEDIAYCLLGILDVNMPILYGEGPKAFLRLQEEIIKTDDHSVFAWTSPSATKGTYRGLFARSPAEFADCGNIKAFQVGQGDPLWMTNRGVRVTLPYTACSDDLNEFMAHLDCGTPDYEHIMVIRVRKLNSAKGDDRFARVDCARQKLYPRGPFPLVKTLTMTICTRQKPLPQSKFYSLRIAGLVFPALNLPAMYKVAPESCIISEKPLKIALQADEAEEPPHSLRIMLSTKSKDYNAVMLVEWNSSVGMCRSVAAADHLVFQNHGSPSSFILTPATGMWNMARQVMAMLWESRKKMERPRRACGTSGRSRDSSATSSSSW